LARRSKRGAQPLTMYAPYRVAALSWAGYPERWPHKIATSRQGNRMALFYGPNGEPLGEVDHAAITRCPHRLLMFEHYRPDGSCRCDDATHEEMLNWRASSGKTAGDVQTAASGASHTSSRLTLVAGCTSPNEQEPTLEPAQESGQGQGRKLAEQTAEPAAGRSACDRRALRDSRPRPWMVRGLELEMRAQAPSLVRHAQQP
jgi:hypothetical protein